MSVRGIEPSYFAGMPTTQRDPRAGQMGEGYAQMPGQALTEIANRNERKSEVDQNNAFRAREQSHREAQDAQSGARDDRRLAMYQQGEDRRQTQQQFENDRLKSADTRKLVQALQAALDDGEQGIAAAIASELHGRGVDVKPIAAAASPAPAAAPGTPPAPGGAPAADGISPQTHSLAARLRGQLSEAPATGDAIRGVLPKSASPAAPAPRQSTPGDAALSGQLDQIENQYMTGLGANQRPLLPGGSRSPLRAQVAQSNAMLSPDDPLNKIVQ